MHRDSLRVALFEDAMRNERTGLEIAIYLLKQSRDGGFIMRHRLGFSRSLLLTILRLIEANNYIDGLLLGVGFGFHFYIWAATTGRALRQTSHEFPHSFLPEVFNVRRVE